MTGPFKLAACLILTGLVAGRAMAAGEIVKYESQRLVLHTDVRPATAATRTIRLVAKKPNFLLLL